MADQNATTWTAHRAGYAAERAILARRTIVAAPAASALGGRGRLWATALLLLACLLPGGGCQQLRLPAIDPTGAGLFAPYPTTTTLALPCTNGEDCVCASCLRKVRDHVRDTKAKTHSFLEQFHRGATTPAFTQPATPPVCLETTGPTTLPPCGRDLTIADDCGDDCRYGPPAVLHGDEALGKPVHRHRLPTQGERGRILLSPQKIVAPVGGEVILMSGICGNDGYLQVGEPLEWMLTPDSVGTFIEVGNDAPGMLHKLAKLDRADKKSGSYALGVTSTKRALITRGNLDRSDDVPLEKGQTWLSISSPSEGTSRVTVLAPASDCWDQRKATATIYWIDARWQFPESRAEPAGTPITMTTRVTRAEGTIPARGWTVRYEVANPELALFAPAVNSPPGSPGSSVLETTVDQDGRATVELIPVRKADGSFPSGTTAVNVQVIRPGNDRDNMPDLTLGSGQAFVTWSAPQLALRAGAPAVASHNVPFEVFANLQNPGDQAASNVQVTVALPPGVRVTQADTFAVVTPNHVSWDLGTLPAQTQLDLFMSVVTESSVRLTYEARGDGGLFATDTVQVDVFRPSLELRVQPASDEVVEVGSPVTFNIDVTNTGDRPLTGVNLRVVGDQSMTHPETGSRIIGQDYTAGALQPGQTWSSASSFIPLDSGSRCVTVDAFADGGQQASQQACVTVRNRPVAVPALTATITGPPRLASGDTRLFAYRVVNTGQVPLNNVRITVTFDAGLELRQATEGRDVSRLGQYQIGWMIPQMPVGPDPRSTVLLEGEYQAMSVNPRASMIVTVESAEGARASDNFAFEIVPGTAASVAPPTGSIPSLPPISATPSIPADRPSATGPSVAEAMPAPIPGAASRTIPDVAPLSGSGAAPAAGGPSLVLSLLDRDDPVPAGQPIRYSLTVRNTSQQVDSGVGIRFQLPPGVELTRVTQRLSPQTNAFRRDGNTIYLQDIRDLRGGEAIDYEIEMVSNQPQSIDFRVEAVSQLTPGGTFANQSTRIVR